MRPRHRRDLNGRPVADFENPISSSLSEKEAAELGKGQSSSLVYYLPVAHFRVKGAVLQILLLTLPNFPSYATRILQVRLGPRQAEG